MNFLAHAYLSGDSEGILVGNFIADAVKGQQYLKFPPEVIKGIQVHRKIDEYTDSHPVVNQSKVRLRPRFGKYAPVIVDIFYDHFLAVNWNQYSTVSLADYAQYTYSVIDKYSDILPEEVHHFFPYMKKGNWLYNYSNMEGLQRVFNGMSKRASFISGMENAPEELQKDYDAYGEEFKIFFEDLRKHVAQVLSELEN